MSRGCGKRHWRLACRRYSSCHICKRPLPLKSTSSNTLGARNRRKSVYFATWRCKNKKKNGIHTKCYRCDPRNYIHGDYEGSIISIIDTFFFNCEKQRDFRVDLNCLYVYVCEVLNRSRGLPCGKGRDFGATGPACLRDVILAGLEDSVAELDLFLLFGPNSSRLLLFEDIALKREIKITLMKFLSV